MKKNNKGFSLVELIIVIAIMAVLIGLIAPQYLKFVKKSRVAADMSNAQSVADAVNCAITDSAIGAVPNQITGAGGDAVTGVSGLSTLPFSKVDSSFTWIINSTSDDGVTSIYLGGDQIYPGSEANNAYYVAHYGN